MIGVDEKVLREGALAYVQQISGHGKNQTKDLGVVVILVAPGVPPQWASNMQRPDVRRLWDMLSSDAAIDAMTLQRPG